MPTPPAVLDIQPSTSTPTDIAEIGSRLVKMESILESIAPTIQQSIQALQTSQDKKLTTIAENVGKVTDEVKLLKQENIILKAENTTLTERVDALEAYSRKNGLLIKHVPVTEQVPLKISVTTILTNMQVPNAVHSYI